MQRRRVNSHSLVLFVAKVSGGAECANTMFKALISRVLRAPMSYFETTPLGHIVNRFTYDVEVLDIELSISMTGVMISSSWLLSSVIVMVSTSHLIPLAELSSLKHLLLTRQAAVLPWSIFALVPVCIMYYYMQLYYRMSGPDLQRIDATSRSPLQASLAEGTSSIWPSTLYYYGIILNLFSSGWILLT